MKVIFRRSLFSVFEQIGRVLNYRFQIQKNILYVTVQQETVRQVQIMTFNHLLHLKYEWHVKRKTGEVLRANDRGANSGQGQIGSVKSMGNRPVF